MRERGRERESAKESNSVRRPKRIEGRWRGERNIERWENEHRVMGERTFVIEGKTIACKHTHVIAFVRTTGHTTAC